MCEALHRIAGGTGVKQNDTKGELGTQTQRPGLMAKRGASITPDARQVTRRGSMTAYGYILEVAGFLLVWALVVTTMAAAG